MDVDMKISGDPDSGHTDDSTKDSTPRNSNETEETFFELEDDSGLDHAMLDKNVIDALNRTRLPGIKQDWELNSIIDCASLIRQIVRGYKKMHPQFKNIDIGMSLLASHPALIPVLVSCMDNKSFARVRRLAILRRPELQMTPSEFQATSDAWHGPYVGQTPSLLLTCINKMNTTRKPTTSYANFVPIIQSSGTGKSRAVHELAKHVFTLPFNLREEAGGYPPSDDDVRDYLVYTGSTYNHGYFEFYELFLASVFTVVQQEIASWDKMESYEELASCWSRHLAQPSDASHRDRLYAQALKLCREQKAESQNYLTNQLLSAAEALIKTIDSKAGEKNPRATGTVCLLLYFDEAHTLASRTINPASEATKTLYHLLCGALDVLSRLDIFTVFLSTVSHYRSYSPPQKGHPSYRFSELKFDPLQIPITEMPFDCHPGMTKLVKPHEHTLETISKVEFMVKFGRPLFWSRWMYGDENVRGGMIKFAQETLKLVDRDICTDRNVAFATISMRVLLEFEPSRRSARLMEQEQIQNYMRIAYSVPSHQEYMRSGNPSEPILAEAAAQEMNKLTNEKLIEYVVDFAGSGLIKKGERGELVSRLLLTIAHDDAIKAYRDGMFKLYSSSVPLLLFLKHLFTDTAMNRIEASLPDNVADGTTFQEQFKDAHVRFSHFVKAEDQSFVTTHAAFAAIARGFAFQCSDQKEDIGILIPVVLNDKALSEENVTAMFISTKNRDKHQKLEIDEALFEFFPKGSTDHRPYIVLSMELGLDCKNEDTAVRVGKASGGRGTRNKNHPRYRISASGCSSVTFRAVTPQIEGALRQLLPPPVLISEHPHQDDQFLSALQRLKPLWKQGRECYDWIENPLLNPSLEADQEREGVDEAMSEESEWE